LIRMFSITNKTRNESPLSGSFFKKIKNKIVGQNYSLSLVFVGDKFSQKLNLKHRGKNKPANVLSFSIDKEVGEIFLNIGRAKKEAPKYELSQKNFIIFLFIHALLHLKNYEHGTRMSEQEKYWLKKFKTTPTRNTL